MAQYLDSHCAPSDQQVTNIVNNFVTANAPLAGAIWSASYLHSDGSSTAADVTSGNVPSGASGVLITPAVQSQNFFEQVLGSRFISVSARGGAVGGINSPTGGSPAGGSSAPAIVALDAGNHIWSHTIISDANGAFDVTGMTAAAAASSTTPATAPGTPAARTARTTTATAATLTRLMPKRAAP